MTTAQYRSAILAIPPSAITTLLCTICLVFVFLYIYFVAASVLHVVVRKEAENSSATIQSEIATLETSLIAAQHTISTRLATLDGFTREQAKVFVTRGASDGLVLGNRPE